MKKTIGLQSVVRIRQDTDDKAYGFRFFVVDSDLVGEPEGRSSASYHKIRVEIDFRVLFNWQLIDASEPDLVKVLFHYARRHIENKVKAGGLQEYEELRLSMDEHREGRCPLDISLIPEPIGFTTEIEVPDMQEPNNGVVVRTAVMLTALPVEYSAVRVHLTEIQEEVHPQGTVYERGKFLSVAGETWEVGLVEIGMGNPQAAREAERAIQYFQPSVMFFVGVAGGIKDVKLGDVVAATKIYEYAAGKDEEIFRPRPNVRNSAYSMIQRARAEARKSTWLQRIVEPRTTSPCAFVGPIAAGPVVVASRKAVTYEFIRANYSDALIVEMEGFGFLEAVDANLGVQALVVRGVSDLVDDKAQVDREGFQSIAAQNAAAFAFEILANLIVPVKTSEVAHLSEPIEDTRHISEIPSRWNPWK